MTSQCTRFVNNNLGFFTDYLASESRNQDRDLETKVLKPRPRPLLSELQCTRVWRPFSWDHNTETKSFIYIFTWEISLDIVQPGWAATEHHHVHYWQYTTWT